MHSFLPESGNKYSSRWTDEDLQTRKAKAVNLLISLCEWEVRSSCHGCGYDFFIGIVSFLFVSAKWQPCLEDVHFKWRHKDKCTYGSNTRKKPNKTHIVRHSVFYRSCRTDSQQSSTLCFRYARLTAVRFVPTPWSRTLTHTQEHTQTQALQFLLKRTQTFLNLKCHICNCTERAAEHSADTLAGPLEPDPSTFVIFRKR